MLALLLRPSLVIFSSITFFSFDPFLQIMLFSNAPLVVFLSMSSQFTTDALVLAFFCLPWIAVFAPFGWFQFPLCRAVGYRILVSLPLVMISHCSFCFCFLSFRCFRKLFDVLQGGVLARKIRVDFCDSRLHSVGHLDFPLIFS